MGSKSTQTGGFYSCFRRSLTENSGIAIQDWDSGITRKFSCPASTEKSSKIFQRKDLPSGREDRHGRDGEDPVVAPPSGWGQDHGIMEWVGFERI